MIKQFNDKNVSVWSMVRLFDRRANASASPVSPGLSFVASAANNSVFNGKWVIRGSFVKTSTGDDCRTPTAADMEKGFRFQAQQILGAELQTGK